MNDQDVMRRNENELVGLCTEAARGRITRRQFMERALVLGLSAGAVGALAGACGSGDGEGAGDAATLPAMVETKPAEITFYNWTDYIDPAIKKDFQKETGIAVKEVFFSSNEEVLAKLRAGAKGYDVIVPSDYMVHIMIKSRLLEPLDMKYLPNYQYVGEEFKKPAYDNPDENGGLIYSVPYFYGTTGYVQRTDKITTPQTAWDDALGRAVQGPDQHARRRARVSRRGPQAARLLAEHHEPGRARPGGRQADRAEAAGEHLRLRQHEARHGPGPAAGDVLGRRRAHGHRCHGRRRQGQGARQFRPTDGRLRPLDRHERHAHRQQQPLRRPPLDGLPHGPEGGRQERELGLVSLLHAGLAAVHRRVRAEPHAERGGTAARRDDGRPRRIRRATTPTPGGR